MRKAQDVDHGDVLAYLATYLAHVVPLPDELHWRWVPFVIARSRLALRGELPWRLMAFLEDCHRLGILRQVGAVYQFRHARLQDHLALAPTDQYLQSSTRTP